jgi:RimJ/RimL family protein N-acetyltransferase
LAVAVPVRYGAGHREEAAVGVIETARLSLRQLTAADAEFILELLNEPPFIQNIGDRGVRTLADAARYILNGPVASYETHGFGLYLVELSASRAPIGICGLLKRDFLDDADIGFALLQRFWSQGYAYEAASAVMEYGRNVLGLKRILAVTAPDNPSSIRLLGKIGLRFDKTIGMPGAEEPRRLFSSDTQ